MKDEEIAEIEKILDNKRKSRSEGSGNITRQVKMANTSETSTYKNFNVTNFQEKNNEPDNSQRREGKRSVKNKPQNFNKVKKFIVIGMVMGGVLIAGINGANNFKQEQADRSLNAVKAEIAEDVGVDIKDVKIWDSSSLTSSVRFEEHITVFIKGKPYSFVREIIDGESREPEVDQIGNHTVVNAVKIVANAQDGYLTDAIRAKKLTEEIERGEADFRIYGATKDLEKEKSDEGR